MEEPKDDGVKLILEPGYKSEDLKRYIKSTCLAEKCSFLESNSDVENICKRFLELLNDELTLDEITTLFVAVSMTYYVQATPENIEWRTHLLQKTFNYVDTLNPLHLHVATKRLWDGLKSDGIEFVFNILTICNQIAIASETGKAIAICLIWSILCEITETKIDMYCFREFSELMKMLKGIDDETLQLEESTQIVYILVKVIGFLMNTIVFGHNEELKKAGYRNYFTYTRRDLERLKNWTEKLCATLKISTSKTNTFWDLRMTINEYINSNITIILQDKITDMQTSAVIK